MSDQFPAFKASSFYCPFCTAYAHMEWKKSSILNRGCNLWNAECQHCFSESIWRTKQDSSGLYLDKKMIYPDVSIPVVPEEDMPDDVKYDFEEAKLVFNKSPKAAAALLRLALQKLCVHLGEPGKNINTDIKSLVAKGVLSAGITKAADTVRIVGNNAVHPGEMNDEDIDLIAEKMFDLLNFIVKKTITEPKELDDLYSITPENSRKGVDVRDKN